MVRTGVCVILILAIFSSCASNPEVPEENPTGISFQEESQLLTDAITAIAIASPDSLRRALEHLGSPDVSESERGRELAFVALRLFDILYPLIDPPEFAALPPPTGSIYPNMFDEIENGRYPTVSQEDASFLTLVLPPLSILYTMRGEVVAQSSEALAQAIQLNPNSMLPYLLQGVIAERSAMLGDAELYFDRALQIAPSCYPARINLARVYYLTGQNDPAYASISILKGNFPDNSEILALSSRILFSRGQNEDAAQEVLNAIRADHEEDVTLLLLRAQILEAMGTDSQARRLLSIVETQMPNDREVLVLKIELLRKSDDLNGAISVLEHAIALFPDDEELRGMYGKLLIDAGRSEEGKQLLVETLEQDPDSVESLEILLGEAETRENWRDAGEYIQRLLELDTSPEYLRRAVLIYRALGRNVTAAGYAELLSRDPGVMIEDLTAFGQILIELERNEQAAEVLAEALEGADTGRQRSDIFYHQSRITHDDNLKLDSLNRSLYWDPQNFDALVAISALFESQGNIRKAQQWLNQAVLLRPENENLRKKLEELQSQLQ